MWQCGWNLNGLMDPMVIKCGWTINEIEVSFATSSNSMEDFPAMPSATLMVDHVGYQYWWHGRHVIIGHECGNPLKWETENIPNFPTTTGVYLKQLKWFEGPTALSSDHWHIRSDSSLVCTWRVWPKSIQSEFLFFFDQYPKVWSVICGPTVVSCGKSNKASPKNVGF